MEIEVGDRVTYKRMNGEKTKTVIIETDNEARSYENDFEIGYHKLLKIERPNWEVVEEKKELLTEGEREFLKIYTKFNKIKYDKLRFCTDCVEFWNDISIMSYHVNNKFKNIELGRFYEKQELRIGGLNGRRNKANRRKY